MKKFKGSNFLLLLILLIDFVYILPLTCEFFPKSGDGKTKENLSALTSLIIHCILLVIAIVRPFLYDSELINWGEDICTKERISKYDPQYSYRLSIVLLIIYLVYQPVKRMINWTDKYLTIKLNDND